jgi:hypothetical protein
MANQTHFNLEDAVRRWRQDLRLSGGVTEDQGAELQAHLRESIARLREQGLTDEEAFLVGCHRLGSAPEITTEFGKVNTAVECPSQIGRVWRIWAGACLILALFFFWLGNTALSYGGERFHGRVAFAEALVAAANANLRAESRFIFLPMVALATTAVILFFRFAANQRARRVIIGCCLGAAGAFLLYEVRQDFFAALCGYLVGLPQLTIRVLAGREDGEFFQDGLAAGLAYGWWIFLWLPFALRELISSAASRLRPRHTLRLT